MRKPGCGGEQMICIEPCRGDLGRIKGIAVVRGDFRRFWVGRSVARLFRLIRPGARCLHGLCVMVADSEQQCGAVASAHDCAMVAGGQHAFRRGDLRFRGISILQSVLAVSPRREPGVVDKMVGAP